MIGSLGTVVFEVSAGLVRTFDSFKRDGSSRWAKHDVHKIKPVSEFLGPDLDKISFSMQLNAARGVNPQGELDILRSYRDEGKAVALIIGEKPIGSGLYTIQSLSEEWTTVDNRGVLIAAVVNVELQEYLETVARPVVKKAVQALPVKKVAPTKKSGTAATTVKKKATKTMSMADFGRISRGDQTVTSNADFFRIGRG